MIISIGGFIIATLNYGSPVLTQTKTSLTQIL